MTTPVIRSSFGGVWLHSHDVDASVAFYRDVLGIPLIKRGSVGIGYFDNGVEFVVEPDHGRDIQVPGTLGVTLRILDLKEAASRLRALGIEVDGVHAGSDGDWFEFLDPDGYKVCFMDPPGQAGAQ